jgi:hypothetical protein
MSVSSKSSGITSNRWFKPVAVTVVALVIALILVLVAQWLRTLEPVKQFLTDYPGHSELPEGAPTGLPAWLGWQHFLNMFFIVLIIRSGWQVRTTTRPPGYWTRNNKGFIKTRNAPTKISLDLWFHLTLDALWVLNGLIFIVLLFATGQWMRIVPTSGFGRPPVRVAELAAGKRLGQLQRLAAADLLHHGLHRGAAGHHYRHPHVRGVAQEGSGQQVLPH